MTNFVQILTVSLILCLNLSELTLGKTWDTLHMTWVPPPPPVDNQFAFANLPLTRQEAEENGYKRLDDNELYKGCRYINKDDDLTNILLFNTDDEGKLVGIQSQFPESKIITKSDWIKWFEDEVMFTIEDKDGDRYFTLTAYTVDPTMIGQTIDCANNVGCGLWFQQRQDSDVDEFWKIPTTTSEMGDDSWVEEKCVDGMAVHYLWNISGNMDCMYFRPFFLLFMGEPEMNEQEIDSSKKEVINRELTGFGWQVQSHFSFSERLEHPPEDASTFFYDVPKCLGELWETTKGINSLHFFFNDEPDKFKCPPGSNQKKD